MGACRKHVLSGIDASLNRLDMDYVDLYQIHRWDRDADGGNTGGAARRGAGGQGPLHRGQLHVRLAVRQGPVPRRSPRLDPLRLHAAPLQPHLPRGRARNDPPLLDQGIGVIPWSPLARGFLAGNRSRDGEHRTTRSDSDAFTDYLYSEPADFAVVDRVADVASERGVPPAQIALAWLLQRPAVTAPIVGATKPGHLADALAAEALELSDAEIKRVEDPYVPHPVLGHF